MSKFCTFCMTGFSSLLSMGIDVECTHVLVQRCLRRTYDDLLTKICYSDYSIVRGIIINFASQHRYCHWDVDNDDPINTYCFNYKLYYFTPFQRAKKVVSDSPGLVDFAIRLVNSVLNLSDGQAKIFQRIKITKVL